MRRTMTLLSRGSSKPTPECDECRMHVCIVNARVMGGVRVYAIIV